MSLDRGDPLSQLSSGVDSVKAGPVPGRESDFGSVRPSSRLLQRVKGALKPWLLSPHVPLFWSKTANWGDALSPWLAERISGRPARFESTPFVRKFLAIGSILHHADEWSTIWGSGLISPDHLPKSRPSRILAVRGPLTRARLMQSGLECPAVYGDPALLLPRYLPMPRTAEFPVGIVPHHTDKDHPWVETCRRDGHFVLDVESGIEDFVRQVCSCEAILSSSLHGLICADAYGIPSRRILLGEELIGGDFKFEDYAAAMGRSAPKPLRPRREDPAKSLADQCLLFPVACDLDQLLRVCPFGRRSA